MKLNIRKPYDRERFAFKCDGDSLTEQSHADSCDVNKIVAQAVRNGVPLDLPDTSAFADVSDTMPYDEAIRVVRQAEDSFMNLPASLRARFDNSPSAFLDFFNDPDNYDECVDLGLIVSDREALSASQTEQPQAEKSAEGAPSSEDVAD